MDNVINFLKKKKDEVVQSLNDDRGLVQRGKFAPIQGKPIRSPVPNYTPQNMGQYNAPQFGSLGYKINNVQRTVLKPLARVADNFKFAAENPATAGRFLNQTIQKAPILPSGIKQGIGNFVANAGQTAFSGMGDIVQGGKRLQQQAGWNKAAGALQIVRGIGKSAIPFTPGSNSLFSGANVLSSGPQIGQGDATRRISKGIITGMSGESLAQNVRGRNVKINTPVGEIAFDPYQGAGSMIGFVKNPVNDKFFKLTEAVLPSSGIIGEWLLKTAARGGAENIALNLPDMDVNLSPQQKAQWVLSTFGSGAGQEIVGRGMLAGLGKLNSKTIGDPAVQKQLAGVYDKISDQIRVWKRPVNMYYQELGKSVKAPQILHDLGIAKALNDDRGFAKLDEPIGGTSAKVKVFVTKQDRQQLFDLGYTRDQIKKMKPVDVQNILSGQQPPKPQEINTGAYTAIDTTTGKISGQDPLDTMRGLLGSDTPGMSTAQVRGNQMRNIPPTPPGGNPPQSPNMTDGPRNTTLGEIESIIYGQATPSRSEFQQGTKEGAGFISDALRKGQERISISVGRMTENNNQVIRNVGRLLQGFAGGLGKTQQDVLRKSQFGGSIDYAAKIARDSQNYVYNLVKSDPKSLERIHAVLDPELAKTKVDAKDLTPEEAQALDFLTKVSDFINDTNYKNGFISKELWEKNRGGKYIARAYEPIDFPPEVADFLKQRNDRLDLNPFFRREDLNDWKQANAIRDPAYLLSKRLQQTLFNNEVKRMSESLAQTEYVSKTPKPGYVQVSDHRSYGKLANQYVRKDVLEDLRGFFFTHDAAQKMYDVLNWWDRNPARRTYKKLFTVFNPAVRLGNQTGNFVFAWMNGINPVTFAKNIKAASEEIDNNGTLYRRMIKDGLVGTDVTKADITKFAEDIRRQTTDKSILQKLNAVVKDFEEGYGKTDDLAKVAAMKTWLDRGYSYDEAARRVLNGFQNYRTVGFLYDLGAKVPVLGNPFVRFKGDLARIIKNSVVDHPFRTASTLMGWKLFTDVMSYMQGETDEDRQTRESRVGAPRIPFTNISLAVQTPWGELNAARLVGAYAYNPVGGASFRSDASEYLPFELPDKRNIGTDPVIGPLINLALDTDFRGKSIADPNQNKYTGSTLTQGERNMNRLNYLRRSYTPTFINAGEDLVSSLQGKKDYYGRTLKPLQAALRTYPGVKLEQFGPEEAQAQRDRDAEYQKKGVDFLTSQKKAVMKQYTKGEIDEKTLNSRITNIDRQIAEIQSPETAKSNNFIRLMIGNKQVEAKEGASSTNIDPYVKNYELEKYIGDTPTDPLKKAVYSREKLTKAKEIYKDDGTKYPENVKQAIIEKMGYNVEDIRYDVAANLSTAERASYIADRMAAINNDGQLKQFLKDTRTKSLSGKIMGSKAVYDLLIENGYMDEATKNYLLSFEKEIDSKTRKYTKKAKKGSIKLGTTPKYSAPKISIKTSPISVNIPQQAVKIARISGGNQPKSINLKSGRNVINTGRLRVRA